MPISTTQPADVVGQLNSLAHCGDYSLMLTRSAEIARRVPRSEAPDVLVTELTAFASTGPIPALMAIESLAQVRHRSASDALVELLAHPDRIVRRHAGWRLGARQPHDAAIPALLDALALGGIDTMHAHRTLRDWSPSTGARIVRQAVARFEGASDPAVKARLVDLLGVLGPDTTDLLLHLALDSDEHPGVRSAAVGALGERTGRRVDDALGRLATTDEEIASDAALALGSRTPGNIARVDHTEGSGLRIAQLVLADGLDGQLSLGGRGDTGGVASLLVSLGEALAQSP